MGRMAACRWASDRLTKIIGHARSWSQAKGSGRGVRLSPISTNFKARRPNGHDEHQSRWPIGQLFSPSDNGQLFSPHVLEDRRPRRNVRLDAVR